MLLLGVPQPDAPLTVTTETTEVLDSRSMHLCILFRIPPHAGAGFIFFCLTLFALPFAFLLIVFAAHLKILNGTSNHKRNIKPVFIE